VKRWLIVLLLVSLGLNAGLIYRAATRPSAYDAGGEPTGDPAALRERPRLGPAMADSASWSRQVDHRLRSILQRLDLAPDVAQEYTRIHRESALNIWHAGKDLGQRRHELRDAMLTAERDPGRIRHAVARLTLAQARFDSLVAEAMLAELDVLPPDRQERYLELVPWQRWGDGGHRGHPRHRRHGQPGGGPPGSPGGSTSGGDGRGPHGICPRADCGSCGPQGAGGTDSP
jgi:hypothetical protein